MNSILRQVAERNAEPKDQDEDHPIKLGTGAGLVKEGEKIALPPFTDKVTWANIAHFASLGQPRAIKMIEMREEAEKNARLAAAAADLAANSEQPPDTRRSTVEEDQHAMKNGYLLPPD